jgi:hypothetical protein
MKKILVLIFLVRAMCGNTQPKLFFSLDGLYFNPTYKTYPYCYNSGGIGLKALYRMGKHPFYLGMSYAHTGFKNEISLLQYTMNGILVDTKIESKSVYNSCNIAFRAECIALKNSNGIVTYAEASTGLAGLSTKITVGNYDPALAEQNSQNGNFYQGDYCKPYDASTGTYQVRTNIKNLTWNAYAGVGVQVGLFSLTWRKDTTDTEIGGIFLHFSAGILYANKLNYLRALNQYDIKQGTYVSENNLNAGFMNTVTNEIKEQPVAAIEKSGYMALQLEAGLTINF